MLNEFTNEDSRYDDFTVGFGIVWESYGENNALTLGRSNTPDVMNNAQITGIPGQSFQTVLINLQPKFISFIVFYANNNRTVLVR